MLEFFFDDELWGHKRMINCPEEYSNTSLSIDVLAAHCPYKFEHGIAGAMTDVE